jgi:hypothetical protein
MNMKPGFRPNLLLWAAALLVLLAPMVAAADTRVVTDAEWRADIETVAASIREIHPRPFRSTDRDEFDAIAENLLAAVPELTDKEIIVRLAALVALIDDGHTRLAIPREYPEIGLEFGHTPTPGPEYAALRFSQLPVAFEQFADGVYVTAAHADHRDLIGLQLVAIDGRPVADAMQAVRAITFAENQQLDRLMGADRLSLPEALVALGVADSTDRITLAFEDEDGTARNIDIEPLSGEDLDWSGPFTSNQLPLRLRQPEEKFWSEYIEDGNFVYMQMDEIADGDIPLAEFVVDTLELADRQNARLVIDVRNNFGGSGGLNRTLVTSLIGNDALNRHDRTFVLIGRRTFSAAQMLVNELEQYARVTFVGEPTGSRPDHYGDPKKIRLEHSGLTLRVSRLHWSSYTAFDERAATNPDFPAAWTADDYFSGKDPALALVESIDDTSLQTLLKGAIERQDMQQVARHTLGSQWSAKTYADDFSSVLVNLVSDFAASEKFDNAVLACRIGLYFYPEHSGFSMALRRLSFDE